MTTAANSNFHWNVSTMVPAHADDTSMTMSPSSSSLKGREGRVSPRSTRPTPTLSYTLPTVEDEDYTPTRTNARPKRMSSNPSLNKKPLKSCLKKSSSYCSSIDDMLLNVNNHNSSGLSSAAKTREGTRRGKRKGNLRKHATTDDVKAEQLKEQLWQESGAANVKSQQKPRRRVVSFTDLNRWTAQGALTSSRSSDRLDGSAQNHSNQNNSKPTRRGSPPLVGSSSLPCIMRFCDSSERLEMGETSNATDSSSSRRGNAVWGAVSPTTGRTGSGGSATARRMLLGGRSASKQAATSSQAAAPFMSPLAAPRKPRRRFSNNNDDPPSLSPKAADTATAPSKQQQQGTTLVYDQHPTPAGRRPSRSGRGGPTTVDKSPMRIPRRRNSLGESNHGDNSSNKNKIPTMAAATTLDSSDSSNESLANNASLTNASFHAPLSMSQRTSSNNSTNTKSPIHNRSPMDAFTKKKMPTNVFQDKVDAFMVNTVVSSMS